ncbi:MFS transporter [Nonomuraea sp. NPDC049758]|uniref:MFS transporter n=1 Tax=Nonomuraea sp. NPDC049758 TaxID=3154360 RepID=UPI00344375E4
MWGHFGDRLGRKAMLVASLLLMGAATVGVGLLPTYDRIGVAAPILLLVLRLLQGLSAGGEWGGAALLAVEHAPPGRRGRYGLYSQVGVPAGLILAQLVYVAVTAGLSEAQFASWGWRLPFLFSVVLVAVGLFIRLRVTETPVFRALSAEQARSRRPVLDVFRERPRALLLASASFVANTAIGYVFLAYLLSYGTQVLKVSRNLMLVVVIIGSLTWLAGIVATAIWSDRIGRKPVYLAGSVLLVVWAVPFFLLVDTRVAALMVVAVVVLNVGLAATYGPQSAMFAEMFEPRYRYSGVSFSYAVGALLGGGFAPLVATALHEATGTSLSVSAYMAGVGLISLVAVLAMKETRPRVAAG